MPPPPVLKKKHTLKGKNLFPLVKKFKADRGNVPGVLARVKINVPMENMSNDNIIAAFRELTGESEKELFEMAGKEVTDDALKILLHMSILHANEFGEPEGQLLEEAVQDDKTEEAPPPNKRKKEENVTSTLEQRIKELESKAKKEGEAAVDSAKEKVRCLALQTNPSEPLLLVALEELAKLARKYGDSEASVYEELYRQANINREKVDMTDFILNVLGGKASDVVTKALSKCMKGKSSKNDGNKAKESIDVQSPLLNLYGAPNINPHMSGMMSQPSYGYMPYWGYSQGYKRFRPPFRGQAQGRGVCLFCDMPGHLVKDCEKMKAAKPK